MIDDTIYAPSGYEEIYYLHNDAFWEKQSWYLSRSKNSLQEKGETTICVFMFMCVYLWDGARLRVPIWLQVEAYIVLAFAGVKERKLWAFL